MNLKMKSDTNIFASNQFSYPMIGLLIATVTLLVLTVIIYSAVTLPIGDITISKYSNP